MNNEISNFRKSIILSSSGGFTRANGGNCPPLTDDENSAKRPLPGEKISLHLDPKALFSFCCDLDIYLLGISRL